MSDLKNRRPNNLTIDATTTRPRKRPSLKRSLSFDIPSPTVAGTGPGAWSNHFNSSAYQQRHHHNSISDGPPPASTYDYYPTTTISRNSSQGQPRGSKYSVGVSSSSTKKNSNTFPNETNGSTSSSSSSGGGTKSRRGLKKARTWHPNLDNVPATDPYREARRLKKEKEQESSGGGSSAYSQSRDGSGSGSGKTTFTHQLNLTWLQAENLVAAYEMISVNPLYYSAVEHPPKETCGKKWQTACGDIDIELRGPSFVTDQLYLGDRHDAGDRRKMLELGITHVINATRDISNFFEGQTLGGRKMKYMNVNINDADGVDIMRFFGTTNRFLLGCVRKGGRALIHCRAGVARSTTILCAFLMYFETWRLQPTMIYLRQVREEMVSFFFIPDILYTSERKPFDTFIFFSFKIFVYFNFFFHQKKCRFIIDPNPDFRQQLVLYELLLFGKSSKCSQIIVLTTMNTFICMSILHVSTFFMDSLLFFQTQV